MIENISYSIEKVQRFLSTITDSYTSFVIQTCIKENKIEDGTYTFRVANKNDTTWSKQLQIDKKRKSIKTLDSHEDPLVFSADNLFICLHIDIEKSCLFHKNTDYYIEILSNNRLICKKILPDFFNIVTNSNCNFNSVFEDNNLKTNEDCYMTYHLGKNKDTYIEERQYIKANQKINISTLFGNNEYIGVQFSYENRIPEIEEKYIFVGQKGINYSGICLIDNNYEIKNPYPFNPKYTSLIPKEKLKKISGVEEFVEEYKDKKPYYFTFNYILNPHEYLSKTTYNQDGLYSIPTKKQLKAHFTLDICENCEYKNICCQIVPSGISYDIYKKNLNTVSKEKCIIFKLLKD